MLNIYWLYHSPSIKRVMSASVAAAVALGFKPHFVELADVVQTCSRRGPALFLQHGGHLMQLHRKVPLAPGALSHPLLHRFHQVELRLLETHQRRVGLGAPQILSESHV